MATPVIPMPEGTVLRSDIGQSWNTQHGYVQTPSKHCDRPALMSSFQASGQESLTWLRGQSQDGVLVPPYATFRTWLPGNKPSPVQKPSTTPAQAATIPNSPEAIKAEIARLQGAYKTSLQSKVDSLKAKIEAMQEELVAAELELEELSA